MILDTSAIVAILFNEPERDALLEAISSSASPAISAASVMEASIVLIRQFGPTGQAALTNLLSELGVNVISFDMDQALMAMEGFDRFGKGRHPAKLNLGDCFVYGLAKSKNLPILCKGNEFSQTDASTV